MQSTPDCPEQHKDKEPSFQGGDVNVGWEMIQRLLMRAIEVSQVVRYVSIRRICRELIAGVCKALGLKSNVTVCHKRTLAIAS